MCIVQSIVLKSTSCFPLIHSQFSPRQINFMCEKNGIDQFNSNKNIGGRCHQFTLIRPLFKLVIFCLFASLTAISGWLYFQCKNSQIEKWNGRFTAVSIGTHLHACTGNERAGHTLEGKKGEAKRQKFAWQSVILRWWTSWVGKLNCEICLFVR